jgi:hypothetical protein
LQAITHYAENFDVKSLQGIAHGRQCGALV